MSAPRRRRSAPPSGAGRAGSGVRHRDGQRAQSTGFASCQEFADQLGRSWPSASAALHVPDTQPAIAATAPTAATQAPAGKWRRARVLIPALAAVALLVIGGVFATVKLTEHPKPAAPPTTAAGAPDHARGSQLRSVHRCLPGQLRVGHPHQRQPGAGCACRTADNYAVRSVCGPHGCVATASRLGGETTFAPTLVFDQLGDRWVSVAIGQDKCQGAASEIWEVFTLQPGPSGTFAGDYTAATHNDCEGKHAVTFTRIGDVDVNSLSDPATLPPPVASPAQALHGQYHEKRTFKVRAAPQQTDYAVTTNCLRTGDRCMSFFFAPSGAVEPLVFGDGNWVLDTDTDSQCTRRHGPREEDRAVCAAAATAGSHYAAQRAGQAGTDRLLPRECGFRRNIHAHWRLEPRVVRHLRFGHGA